MVFNLAPSEEGRWGGDRLEGKPLKAGRWVVLKGVPCDEQDAKLVDRQGRACVFEGLYPCATEDT